MKLKKSTSTPILLLSAAERRGTPVLLSALVSDNSGNSPQMSAPRRSREIDQSTQRFSSCCNWRPIRCGDTKCLVSLHAVCCHLCRDININTNWGRVLGKVSCTKNLPLGEYYIISCSIIGNALHVCAKGIG